MYAWNCLIYEAERSYSKNILNEPRTWEQHLVRGIETECWSRVVGVQAMSHQQCVRQPQMTRSCVGQIVHNVVQGSSMNKTTDNGLNELNKEIYELQELDLLAKTVVITLASFIRIILNAGNIIFYKTWLCARKYRKNTFNACIVYSIIYFNVMRYKTILSSVF